MKKKIFPRTGRMHNPPHPGAILKELYMKPAKMSGTFFADKLGVDRKTISRLINARSGITAEMALRLGKLLNTSPDMWLGIQLDYDLWHAAQTHQSTLRSIAPMHFSPQGLA